MIRVFIGRDYIVVSLVRGMLERNGIDAIVHGEAPSAAWGGVPVGDSPSVWVRADDAERARQLISEHARHVNPTHCQRCGYNLRGSPGPCCSECGWEFTRTQSWTCPKCGETIEGQFAQCWKCAEE